MPMLPRPTIMLVTDRHAVAPGTLPDAVAKAVAGGVNVVQLREKDLPVGDLLALGQELQSAIAGRALLLVNDRVDVALALEADGVHLPQDGVPVAVARRILGRDCLIGRSVHSEETARAAAAEGADYLVLGPVWETSSHPGVTPPGLDVLAHLFTGVPLLADHGTLTPDRIADEIRDVAPVPVIGIGGITPLNADELMAVGAAGVAVISSILKAPDIQQAAHDLMRAVTRG